MVSDAIATGGFDDFFGERLSGLYTKMRVMKTLTRAFYVQHTFPSCFMPQEFTNRSDISTKFLV